jgi:hypothetical protein
LGDASQTIGHSGHIQFALMGKERRAQTSAEIDRLQRTWNALGYLARDRQGALVLGDEDFGVQNLGCHEQVNANDIQSWQRKNLCQDFVQVLLIDPEW